MQNFQSQRPTPIQANTSYAPSGDSGKGGILDLALGVGLGLGTGNWAPLANSVLPGSGDAVGALTGGKDKSKPKQGTSGGVEDVADDVPAMQGGVDTLAATAMIPEVGQPLWNMQQPNQQVPQMNQQAPQMQNQAPQMGYPQPQQMQQPQFFFDPMRWPS